MRKDQTARLRLAQLPLRQRWLRWTVLMLGIVLSLGGAYLFQQADKDKARAEFRTKAVDKVNQIELRMRAYSDVLYALRGLFAASSTVTRDDFHEFAGVLSIRERYSGLLNISFSLLVPDDRKDAFERAVRAETSPLVNGLPQFSIKPPGQRAEYLVLYYIEPMGREGAAWGLDFMADPERRGATDRARDTGGITSVSSVRLVRDSNTVATGTLLRLAVYRGGGVPETAAERRRLFIGVVGSTLRVAQMVEATLKSDLTEFVRVRIYAPAPRSRTADAASSEQLLYDSHPPSRAPTVADFSEYSVNQQLAIGDGEWRVMMTPLVNPVAPLDKVMVGGALTIMLGIAAMSFWLMSSLATMQLRGAQLARRNREAELMNSLGEDLHSCLLIEEAYAVLERQMPEIVPRTAGVLYVFDSSRPRADAAAKWGSPRAAADEFAPQDCQSVRRGRLYRVGGEAKALNCGHFTGHPPDCYVCVPLDAQGETMGMLHVQRAAEDAADCTYDDAELNMIKAAAQHFALALANLRLRAKLTERATRDNLTGLYNRHYMQEWLEQELHRAQRHHRTIGVIMLDVDHFKRVNDDFGHPAGDMVLRELAGVIRRAARRSDVACRQGGEEFLLLMPEVTLEGMLGKGEELRQEVARLDLAYEGRPLGSVTVSAGVALYPHHGTTADALLRCADEALYAAKEGGRNRVVVHAARAPSIEPA